MECLDNVEILPRERAPEVVDVLCEAFAEYPVMTHVLGVESRDSRQLKELIGFFTMARFYRGDFVLGIQDQNGRLLAAANLNRPNSEGGSEDLQAHRDRLWRDLGSEARKRYEAYGAACEPFELDEPHYHLGMIGVLNSQRGSGLGRLLLDSVHALSASDPGSIGVTLTTEVEGNVALYEHFGYRVIGQGELAPAVPTWSLFRADE